MAGNERHRSVEGPSPGSAPGPLSRLLQELADASGDDALGAWASELSPGDRVGRYEVRREVGRGGFGAVYEALDTELNRVVAVKALRLGRRRKELASDWLKREAEAVARLDHPCIVTLFDVGTAEQGPYLVMELLRGGTLATRIARAPVPRAEALRISVEIARGLAHAHQRGVLHRDLKPANVFLCEDGRVKLLDFGLAHLLGSPDRAGAGTPAYMAPEQARGEEVDARADVYAAAVMLREMWGAGESRRPRPVPGRLGRLLDRATSTSKETRPRDGTAWMEELSRAGGAGRAQELLRVGAVALAVLAIGSAAAWFLARRPANPTPPRVAENPAAAPPAIAVLAFTDLSPDHDQEYFAEGIAEEVLNALARVRGMRVPGRASSFWFKGKHVEPGEIARKLDVTYLLEGSVRRSGNRVRISAEVVNAATGQRVWSQTFEREITDIFAVQDEIARSVVQAVAPVLFAGSQSLPASRPTDPEAYRLFLLGRYQNSQATEESWRQAIETLNRAAAIDPHFAPAHALLAFANGNLAETKQGEERARLRNSSRAAAQRAVELDPDTAWGYVPRGLYRLSWDLDWKGAREDLDRAYQLDPTSQFVLNARALFLMALGRPSEAVEVQRRAVAQDPLSAVHTDNLAWLLLNQGNDPEACDWARRALEISPTSPGPSGTLAWAALFSGNPREALARFEAMTGPRKLAGVSAAFHALGRERESLEALEALKREHPDAKQLVAVAHAWRGEKDAAFEALDEAVAARVAGLAHVRHARFLAPLRDDTRFAEFLRRTGPMDSAGLTERPVRETPVTPR